MPPARRARPAVLWHEAVPAPVVLVTGPEELLTERAVDNVVAQVRQAQPEVEVVTVDAAAYQSGMLEVLASPSLFDEARVVVVEQLQNCTEALVVDLVRYVASPDPEVVLVVVHGGGVRARKALDAVRDAAGVVVQCDAVKRDGDKADFVSAELRRHGRRADGGAVRALVEACGADLRELAAACSQLAADTTGTISAALVERYHGGRVEASGFRVADAAVEGRAGEAVALLRHAVATGTDPVPVVAAVASKLRILAKVAAARGRGLDAGKDLGIAPWQVDRARRELRGWTPEGLATALLAVAQADAEVKGAGRDPVFAVERAVLRVAAARES